ncbi:MAG: glycosyltransferase family 2 protein, partial [Candidatus Aminicenantes bacterium]|nr:glycosyltransferase family 2 protein [Candidatus Aminicenantes bacterium]
FTTTSTMLFTMENLKVKNVSIDYFKRKGKSKIRPIKDTYNFFLLIMRITMLFNPLRIFMPVFFFTLLLSFGSLARDIYIRNLTDTTVLLFVFSLIIFLIGLLADLINRRQS